MLSREQLLSQVCGFDFDPGSNVVDVYIRYLRKKFGPERIETVRGMGIRHLSMSKYCVGIALLHPHLPANRWNRVLRNRFDWDRAPAEARGVELVA